MEDEIDCAARFYDTTYVKSYYVRPGNNFASLAPPIPEIDPNLAPGHFANNILINGNPIESRTWEKPKIENVPEEYVSYLKKLKAARPCMFKKHFTNPDVDIEVLEDKDKYAKMTEYESVYTPEEYVSKKERLKWPRSKLNTSKYKYHETTYRTYYNRIEESEEMRPLAKPFTWQYDVEPLKNELRKIYRSVKTMYHTQFCEMPIPEMKQRLKEGKVWTPPLDAYTLRRV